MVDTVGVAAVCRAAPAITGDSVVFWIVTDEMLDAPQFVQDTIAGAEALKFWIVTVPMALVPAGMAACTAERMADELTSDTGITAVFVTVTLNGPVTDAAPQLVQVTETADATVELLTVTLVPPKPFGVLTNNGADTTLFGVTLIDDPMLTVALVGNGLLESTGIQDVRVAVSPVAGKHSLVRDCACELEGAASHRAAIASSNMRFMKYALKKDRGICAPAVHPQLLQAIPARIRRIEHKAETISIAGRIAVRQRGRRGVGTHDGRDVRARDGQRRDSTVRGHRELLAVLRRRRKRDVRRRYGRR